MNGTRPDPCPFCGSREGEIFDTVEGEFMRYWVFCRCGATGPVAFMPEEAVALWNSRTPAAPELAAKVGA